MRHPEDRRYAEVTVTARIVGHDVFVHHYWSWQDLDYKVHAFKPTGVRIRAHESCSWPELRLFVTRMCAYVAGLQHDKPNLPRGLYWREIGPEGARPEPPQGATGVVLTPEPNSGRSGDVIKEPDNRIKDAPAGAGTQRAAKRRTSSRTKPAEGAALEVLPGQEELDLT